MVCIGFYWVLLGFTWFCWAPIAFFVVFLTFRGFYGFVDGGYWVLLGFHWVLLRFTGCLRLFCVLSTITGF